MSEPDDNGAAWHQFELEQRRYEEEQALLKSDPAYERWLDELNALNTQKVNSNEIPCES